MEFPPGLQSPGSWNNYFTKEGYRMGKRIDEQLGKIKGKEVTGVS